MRKHKIGTTGKFGQLSISNALISQPEALKRQFEQDGYVYLKNIIDKNKVEELRLDILDCCRRGGWIKPETPLTNGITDSKPSVEGEEEYFEVYDQIQQLESFHSFAHEKSVLEIMRMLLDNSAFPHPTSVARISFPNVKFTTPVHQDYPNNQGTKELYACWIPLGNIPVSLGSLAILPGSHRHGVFALEFCLGPGHRRAVIPDDLKSRQWLSADFSPGDILIFHSLTLHKALRNHSGNRLRLSVDYRYQKEGDALVARNLGAHFGRLKWEDIYRNWKSETLQYYWTAKRYQLQSWSKEYHTLSEEDISRINARFLSTRP